MGPLHLALGKMGCLMRSVQFAACCGRIRPCAHLRRAAHRSMKQCRERYLLHLRPDISNLPWTFEEDTLIIQGHMQHGNK